MYVCRHKQKLLFNGNIKRDNLSQKGCIIVEGIQEDKTINYIE